MLSFFCTKLVPSKEGKKPLLYLKHSYGGKQADELSVSEASLIAFCFPLGAEAVVPKEFMASEVSSCDVDDVVTSTQLAKHSEHSSVLWGLGEMRRGCRSARTREGRRDAASTNDTSMLRTE